ncbi:PKD domain-containing protein [Methanosarcina barkeri]
MISCIGYFVAGTKWKWNFGDGKTSIQQNPTHKYPPRT